MVRFSGPWTHRSVLANGIRFHVAEMLPEPSGKGRPADSVAGSPADLLTTPPLVLLVHGHLGMWWTMRRLLAPLAAAGYHAVAVDLRGYGDSDKPPRGYDPLTLAADVTNLIRALGHTEALMVGHGAGGYICWTAAYRRPRAVRALVTVSSPHPLITRERSLRSVSQGRAMWPALAFDQLPRVAERKLLDEDGAHVERQLRELSGARWRETEDFAETAQVLRQAVQIPKVAHLALEMRRWMVRAELRPDGRAFRRTIGSVLDHDVLAVGGAADPFIHPDTIAASRRYAPKLQLDSFEGIGHYAPMEAPEQLATRIVEFASSLPE